jgi:hypothetical protein
VKIAEHAQREVEGGVYGLRFVADGRRLVVARGGQGTTVLDATTCKEIVAFSEGASIGVLGTDGALASVTDEGKTVAGRHTWAESLWDLATGKKLATLSKNTPDNNLALVTAGATRVLGWRKKKTAYAVCLFDRAGTLVAEHALGTTPLPFHLALSPDERCVAHAYFTGAAALFDLDSGKGHKLTGGALRIGRQHEKGITSLAFTPSGEHLFYESPEAVHVWDVRTRKASAGSWQEGPADIAFCAGPRFITVRTKSSEATATAHDLGATSKSKTITLGAGPVRVAYPGDAKHLAYTEDPASPRAALALVDLATGKRAARCVLPASTKAPLALAACPGRIAVGDRAGRLTIFTYA